VLDDVEEVLVALARVGEISRTYQEQRRPPRAASIDAVAADAKPEVKLRGAV
jgi:hypothetical protein